MNAAELSGVILGGIGAVTGIAGLAIAYRSAKASEVSANAAKSTVEFQISTYRTERTAIVRFVPLNIHGHTIITRIENDILWMDMIISNIGAHWAHDVRLFATVYEKEVASENPPISVAPNSKVSISLPINTTLLPRYVNTKFRLRVDYLDGNGRKNVEFPVQMDGSMDERIVHARFLAVENGGPGI